MRALSKESDLAARFASKFWRGRARVGEAMILLLAARFLIRFVPLRLWRWSLGRPRTTGSPNVAWPLVRAVVRAINRASNRLPVAMVCLPRALAAHWMLMRRGIGPRLVIGIAPGDTVDITHVLHAWVEVDRRIVIGGGGTREYSAELVLQADAALPET